MHIELLNYKYSSLYNYHNKLIVYILLNKIILESFLVLYKGYINKSVFILLFQLFYRFLICKFFFKPNGMD